MAAVAAAGPALTVDRGETVGLKRSLSQVVSCAPLAGTCGQRASTVPVISLAGRQLREREYSLSAPP